MSNPTSSAASSFCPPAAECLPRIIHPTAVIEPGAELGTGVQIGPFCHVGSKAILGDGTKLHSHVVVMGKTRMGKDNVVWPYAVLGGDPQDLKFKGEESELLIGDRNQFRELVTINKGTANDRNVTRVGSDNLIMTGCHIAHDCILGDHIILANDVGLAGHVLIEDWAIVSGMVGTHHFVTIGRHAYIGGMSRLSHDIPPFMIAEGHLGEVRGVNVIGMERCGYSPQAIDRIKQAYRRLYRDTNGSMSQKLDELTAQYPDEPEIDLLVQSLGRSLKGVYGRYRETLRSDSRHPSSSPSASSSPPASLNQ